MKLNNVTVQILSTLLAVTVLAACGKEEKPTPATVINESLKNLPTMPTNPAQGNVPDVQGANIDPRFNLPTRRDFNGATPGMPTMPNIQRPGSFKGVVPGSGF